MHNHGGCDMCYAEIEEAEDGEYIELYNQIRERISNESKV